MSMDNLVRLVEKDQYKQLPDFRPGDTVKVHVKIVEGGKERIQIFEGIVIKIRGSGLGKTFTVRKIASGGIGVERTFPYHSPVVQKIEIVKKAVTRRAKLYYIRDIRGKIRLKERKE
ncbi:ribosomal protein L19 [Pseudothermotoga lettingae TMO]|jgi:large subunit ribosomal protein L19|uniref:Large ribosomal subunit protein bL19 n=2 Tax=Thermotogaceae TaxID=188709 RepID=RL19_PSELT|nr:RecName: Full=Large ribosomal subunit protein bL19; AltName: Full=50S ribosomal protein L19 [Pseudothermotoga lettingae TMO]KUK21758.1 MAG: 50S ribosomal protein L19 [Pseudothermotoga lettingae]MDI3495211.1 large subunit ribosomal protein [Pseudothermotoga sp.]ABV32693.1 ribosomal protein L19 [Pseudothermotoga lettingae TMO]MDK2885303.1 large subunit ribosomal protein [Pseudothermotoga sp.]GLI48314.1 50S ribosomal protein L19 [Pseudothermotoga lettingae TMO]